MYNVQRKGMLAWMRLIVVDEQEYFSFICNKDLWHCS